MTLEESIRTWAKITESQINEVSDIDVDWDNDEMEKMDQKNFHEAFRKIHDLDDKDMVYLLETLLDMLDMDKVHDWFEYWDSCETLQRPKAVDWLKSRIKARTGSYATYDIERVKDEEGL